MNEGAASISDVDLLTIKRLEWYSLPPDIRSQMKIHVMRTDDLSSIEELKRRVVEYVVVKSLDSTIIKPATLNRRFSRLCKKFGTSIMELIIELTPEHLTMMERRGVSAVYSTLIDKEIMANIGVGDFTLDSYQSRTDALWANII